MTPTLLLLLVTLGIAPAQPLEPAKPAKGANGEVTCVDGKTVRIALQNDTVAIETKFGKLAIPAADIERIEFAYRVPDELAKKIDAALKRVANDNFAERKAATNELRELGARAFPALKLATQNNDPEVAKLADTLMNEIRGKVPLGSLKFPKTDRILTADCVVTGRITSELKLIPVTRPGETAVKLADPLVFRGGRTAGPQVEPGIDVGKAALEIEGEDIDGKKITLSDFRGNVVLLHFWGNWCGPCRAMYPHLNSLANKLADEPFVLLGVNSDQTRAAAKKAVADEKIAWRSFWNGGSTGGPISKRFGIQGWPTLFLIDHHGVIRHKWTGSPGADKLKEAVEALVKEASKKD